MGSFELDKVLYKYKVIYCCCNAVSPGKVGRNENAKKSKSVDPLHTLAIDVGRSWVSAELLGFLGVLSEVVFSFTTSFL